MNILKIANYRVDENLLFYILKKFFIIENLKFYKLIKSYLQTNVRVINLYQSNNSGKIRKEFRNE